MSAAPRLPSPLAAPSGAPPRLTRRRFPTYRYVPGLEPHPVNDPEGHSYGLADARVVLGERQLPRDWREVEEYLYGIDLYNAAFFWEAHESWEAVWHAAGHTTLVGRFVQGLIQASAAMLQRHRGRLEGAGTLLSRSTTNLKPAHEWIAAERRSDFMGVDLQAWQVELRAYLSGGSRRFPFLVAEVGSSHRREP